jgi:hypothetical protein
MIFVFAVGEVETERIDAGGEQAMDHLFAAARGAEGCQDLRAAHNPSLSMRMPQPILTGPLFAPIHDELMSLLRGLSPQEWLAPTVAGAWTVRDVAAHLLDTGCAACRRTATATGRRSRRTPSPTVWAAS